MKNPIKSICLTIPSDVPRGLINPPLDHQRMSTINIFAIHNLFWWSSYHLVENKYDAPAIHFLGCKIFWGIFWGENSMVGRFRSPTRNCDGTLKDIIRDIMLFWTIFFWIEDCYMGRSFLVPPPHQQRLFSNGFVQWTPLFGPQLLPPKVFVGHRRGRCSQDVNTQILCSTSTPM